MRVDGRLPRDGKRIRKPSLSWVSSMARRVYGKDNVVGCIVHQRSPGVWACHVELNAVESTALVTRGDTPEEACAMALMALAIKGHAQLYLATDVALNAVIARLS